MEHEAGTRLWHFHGGIRLPHHKQLSTTEPIQNARLPNQLVLALDQHIGAPAGPIVEVGDPVLKGQAIAAAPGHLGAAVHAPSSGTVSAIEDRPVPDPLGGEETCIVIETDGEERWVERDGVPDFTRLGPQEIRQRVSDAGIVGLGGAAFPSHVKLTPPKDTPIESLIINGAECEPYIACDEMLMREQAPSIVAGARIMQRALNARKVVFAIEDEREKIFESLSSALREDGGKDLSLRRVPSIYPEGGEKQLIQMLTGREVPSGGLPIDLGLVCHNVATAAAVYEAIVEGRPLLSRIVSVTGHGIKSPRNFKALIGTPIAELIRQAGGYTDDAARLVMGGPLMGFALATDQVPVVKATNCILALVQSELQLPQPQMPCIRCMECVSVCPAQLLPQQLYWYIEARDLEPMDELGLADCIECGCCAAVCPSQIPLVDYYRHAKSELRLRAMERARAGRARKRHEAREARLAREQSEHATELEAKKQALKAHQSEEIQAAIERAREKNPDKSANKRRMWSPRT